MVESEKKSVREGGIKIKGCSWRESERDSAREKRERTRERE